MNKPIVETAALDAPGGYRMADEPPESLVRELAVWLGRPEGFARQVLAEVRARFDG